MSLTPIFLLSLPRSGSTLLQRLIATHPAVATTSETWLLLPLFLAYRQSHLFASYRQPVLLRAFEDLVEQMPDGRGAYHEAIRRFAETMYQAVAGSNASHFLDKTPRYHLIADELLECFETAGCVLLWRNPLAVAASCIETWGRGRWNLHAYRVDLYQGVPGLLDAWRHHHSRVLALRYEDLVAEPETRMTEVFDHLGLEPIDGVTRRLGEVRLSGRMGDSFSRPGQDRLSQVMDDGGERWLDTFSNPIRRAWARRYISWLGPERLGEMGYSAETLLGQLKATPVSWRRIGSDVALVLRGRYLVTRQRALLGRAHELSRAGIGVDVLCD